MEERKLLVTVAAKVDEDLARRFREIAQRCGMSDSQLFRLILERFDALLSEHWKEFINITTFLECVSFNADKFRLLLEHLHGFKRDGRK